MDRAADLMSLTVRKLEPFKVHSYTTPYAYSRRKSIIKEIARVVGPNL